MKNIFISSTFIDMQAERDLVQERVLPALREEARKYGDNVGVIDLRWGVDTSTLETEEGAAKVLKVCLDEIDRSHPYMLIFLGERYGTMMREDQIERSIRGREDKYTTDDYIKSITALEVEYGALSEKYGELNHCVVCFREPVVHMLDGTEKELYAEHTEEGKRKLEVLKERIKRDLGEDGRLITYSCTWDKSARQLVDFTSNGQPLENVLTGCFVEMFRDDWKEYESLSWQDKEQLGFRALMESKLRSFVGREEILDDYYQNIVYGTDSVILQSEEGGGKTAIMCKLVELLRKEGKNVFTYFSGVGNMSNNAESLVKQMVYYLENLVGIKEHFGEGEVTTKAGYSIDKLLYTAEGEIQYSDWIKYLQELCDSLYTEEKIYICIDSLERLYWDEHVERLDFIPSGKNIQIILSCNNAFKLPENELELWEIKSIPMLNRTEAKLVIEGILASYSRNAYMAIEEEILKKKNVGNPLYISLLIQRLNMMDTDELREAMTEEQIVLLGIEIIRNMPDDLENAILEVAKNGIEKFNTNEELLLEVLQYIAISRRGLRLRDLQEIFIAQTREFPILDITLLMKYLDGFFYVREDGRIDYTHKGIRSGLLVRMDETDRKGEVIKEHIKKLKKEDHLRIEEGMYFARICKDTEFARELIVQAYETKNQKLIYAIKDEIIEDEGLFFCEISRKKVDENLKIERFFVCDELIRYFFSINETNNALIKIVKESILRKEQLNKECISEQVLDYLATAYEKIGPMLEYEERKKVYKKSLKYREELYNRSGSDIALRELANIYEKLQLYSYELEEEHINIHEKEMVSREILYKRSRSDDDLRKLADSYYSMGLHLRYADSKEQKMQSTFYYEKAVKCSEEIYERSKEIKDLETLGSIYRMFGEVLFTKNQEEADVYFEKSLKCFETIFSKERNMRYLSILILQYFYIGFIWWKIGQGDKASIYFDKEKEYRDKLYEIKGDYIELTKLSNTYKIEGDSDYLSEEEAILCYEKYIECQEILYEKTKSRKILHSLMDVCSEIFWLLQLEEEEGEVEVEKINEKDSYFRKKYSCYEQLFYEQTRNDHMRSIFHYDEGCNLEKEGQLVEALDCYKKALNCAEKYYEEQRDEESLQELEARYMRVGDVLKELGQAQEALLFYKKIVRYKKELHEKIESVASLRELISACRFIGDELKEQGRLKEYNAYYKKVITYAEQFHEKQQSDISLRELISCYKIVGDGLNEQNHLRELLTSFQKVLEREEQLFNKFRTFESVKNLADSYSFMGEILRKLGQTRDSLLYYRKGLNLYEKSEGTDAQIVFDVCEKLGDISKNIGQLDMAVTYYEKALKYREKLYWKSGIGDSLSRMHSYYNVSNILRNLGKPQEALTYCLKALKCKEDMYKKKENNINAKELYDDYINVGNKLKNLGQNREALAFYQKAVRMYEELYEKNKNEETMRELLFSYANMRNTLKDLRRPEEALLYYEKILKYKEDLYKGNENNINSQELFCDYMNIGNELMYFGKANEALVFYQKAVHGYEKLYEKSGNEGVLRVLSNGYANLHKALIELEQEMEAVSYYENMLRCMEKLYESNGSDISLEELFINYIKIGNELKDLGHAKEALPYYEKVIMMAESRYEKTENERNLNELLISYNNMGRVLCDLGRYNEALDYFEKYMGGREELYRQDANDVNLTSLSVAYNNYGWILCELERAEEALDYLKKALQYTEELHQKSQTKNTRIELVVRWRNMAKAMLMTKQMPEALEYGRKAVVLDRELYLKEVTNKTKERVMNTLSIYADVLYADTQREKAYEAYAEALKYCISVCDKNDSIPNRRSYVKILKGMYMCLCEQGKEAEEYLLLAKTEAKKLYEHSGAEKDKEILGDIYSG